MVWIGRYSSDRKPTGISEVHACEFTGVIILRNLTCSVKLSLYATSTSAQRGTPDSTTLRRLQLFSTAAEHANHHNANHHNIPQPLATKAANATALTNIDALMHYLEVLLLNRLEMATSNAQVQTEKKIKLVKGVL